MVRSGSYSFASNGIVLTVGTIRIVGWLRGLLAKVVIRVAGACGVGARSLWVFSSGDPVLWGCEAAVAPVGRILGLAWRSAGGLWGVR